MEKVSYSRLPPWVSRECHRNVRRFQRIGKIWWKIQNFLAPKIISLFPAPNLSVLGSNLFNTIFWCRRRRREQYLVETRTSCNGETFGFRLLPDALVILAGWGYGDKENKNEKIQGTFVIGRVAKFVCSRLAKWEEYGNMSPVREKVQAMMDELAAFPWWWCYLSRWKREEVSRRRTDEGFWRFSTRNKFSKNVFFDILHKETLFQSFFRNFLLKISQVSSTKTVSFRNFSVLWKKFEVRLNILWVFQKVL